jgi:hypothetical protein
MGRLETSFGQSRLTQMDNDIFINKAFYGMYDGWQEIPAHAASGTCEFPSG